MKLPYLTGEKGSRIVVTILGICLIAGIVTIKPDLKIVAAIRGLGFSLTLNLVFPAVLYLRAIRMPAERLSLLTAPRGIAPSSYDSTRGSSSGAHGKDSAGGSNLMNRIMCWTCLVDENFI